MNTNYKLVFYIDSGNNPLSKNQLVLEVYKDDEDP